MNFNELYNEADYKNDMGMLFNCDCMNLMSALNNSNERERERERVDLTLTDIPYNAVNRKSNGLRNLDKDKADIMTFDLSKFLQNVYNITNGTIIIFCGMNQVSEIFNYFDEYAKKGKEQ